MGDSLSGCQRFICLGVEIAESYDYLYCGSPSFLTYLLRVSLVTYTILSIYPSIVYCAETAIKTTEHIKSKTFKRHNTN